MSMRVISGSVGGFRLKGPQTRETRPMSNKIRQALFSSMASLGIDSVRVLDLYAGTGSIGIESLSRGATWCDFVDQGKDACTVITANLAHTGMSEISRIHKVPTATFLTQTRSSWDTIFIDPPYADPAILETIGFIANSTLLESGGIVAIGHSPRMELPDSIGTLVRIRHRCHGDSCFSIYDSFHEEEHQEAESK